MWLYEPSDSTPPKKIKKKKLSPNLSVGSSNPIMTLEPSIELHEAPAHALKILGSTLPAACVAHGAWKRSRSLQPKKIASEVGKIMIFRFWTICLKMSAQPQQPPPEVSPAKDHCTEVFSFGSQGTDGWQLRHGIGLQQLPLEVPEEGAGSSPCTGRLEGAESCVDGLQRQPGGNHDTHTHTLGAVGRNVETELVWVCGDLMGLNGIQWDLVGFDVVNPTNPLFGHDIHPLS